MFQLPDDLWRFGRHALRSLALVSTDGVSLGCHFYRANLEDLKRQTADGEQNKLKKRILNRLWGFLKNRNVKRACNKTAFMVFVRFILLFLILVAGLVVSVLYIGPYSMFFCLALFLVTYVLSIATFILEKKSKAPSRKKLVVARRAIWCLIFVIGTSSFWYWCLKVPETFPIQADWSCERRNIGNHIAEYPSRYQRYRAPISMPEAANLEENHFAQFGPWQHQKRTTKAELFLEDPSHTKDENAIQTMVQ